MVQSGAEQSVHVRTAGTAVRAATQCARVDIRTDSTHRVGRPSAWGGAGRKRYTHTTLEAKGQYKGEH